MISKYMKVEVPDDTELSTFAGHFLISLRKEWKLQGKVYPSGSLLSAPVDSLIAGDTVSFNIIVLFRLSFVLFCRVI